MSQKIKKQKLRAVIVSSLMTLLVIFGLIADFIGYYQFTKTLTENDKNYAAAVAAEAASMIDADRLESFLEEKGGSEEFRQVHDKIQTLCDAMNVRYIYVAFVEKDFSEITFVIESVNSSSGYAEYPVGYKMNISEGENAVYQPRFRDLLTGDMELNVVVSDKGRNSAEHHIAALIPLRGSDGSVKAVLCAQKQMEELQSAREQYIRSIVHATLLLILVAGTSWFFMLRTRLLKPISEISSEARRFAAEGTIAPEPVTEKIRYKDELGELAVTIREMERQTVESFEKINRINAEKQRVDTELNLARDIQAHMLPNIFPPFPDHGEFDIYAAMDPAREVGGDFYDFFMVGKNTLGVVMADVSGKGVPAALFMVITKTLIKNYAQMGMSPSEVFEKVNRMLCDGNDIGYFVTAWMALLDIETGALTCCNAGHNPPMLGGANGDYTFIKAPSGLVLGGDADFEYGEFRLQMKKGDRLFLYTDGITEAKNEKDELYGNKRLSSFINNGKNAGLAETLKGLRADIDQFTGTAEQFDDMTMLLLEYRKEL